MYEPSRMAEMTNPHIVRELSRLSPSEFDLLRSLRDNNSKHSYPYMLVGRNRIIVLDEFRTPRFVGGRKRWLKVSGALSKMHKRLEALSAKFPQAVIQGALINSERKFRPYFADGVLVSPLVYFNELALQTQLHWDISKANEIEPLKDRLVAEFGLGKI